jgi:hypothetical protein
MNTSEVRIHGSYGMFVVDRQSGLIIGGDWDAEYDDIFRFNPNHLWDDELDILAVGFWTADGEYEYPDRNWLRERGGYSKEEVDVLMKDPRIS